MKTTSKILKIKSHYQPFDFFDIDKENSTFTIGSMSSDEDVFMSGDVPNYINIMCEINPIKDFNQSINISSTYQAMSGKPDSTKEFSRNIYDGSNIPVNGFVSSLDIVYRDILPETEIPGEWREFLTENSKIYTKNFVVQRKNLKLQMSEDPKFETNIYNHLISNAYPYAGVYYKGISIEDIEQSFFYIGTELQAKEYINTISSKKLLSGSSLRLCPGIKGSDITSLQDDVSSGNIRITMPDKTVYQSICIKKNTVISNMCVITFRRK